MDIGTFRGITTLLVLFCFLGIVFWAYSKRRKKDFDEASRLPFADDEDESTPGNEPSASTDETRQAHSRQDEGDKHS
ncbi:MAG TPA: cbb3-type cytochrome c oxidase subunit 3 [Modicisalibacter sp.]|nr:cbb3-type cytochrome c oxidase subunit 3 [Modicisalibacter sp.]